jgi:hypothetical protein
MEDQRHNILGRHPGVGSMAATNEGDKADWSKWLP